MKRLIYLAILLLATAIQAQNFDEPKNASIPDEETKTATKSAEKEPHNASVVAAAMEKVFYINAKRAGLTDDKTKDLIKIIDERNQVLKDLDTRKKQANAPFSIEDPGTLFNFKIKEARNRYAKKISQLVTYNQYCYFVVDNYREEAIEKAKPEYMQLSKGNPDLTKDQKQKLYKLIYSYHLNQLLTNSYLSFDSNLLKPKLGVLRFNFEKEFAKTCKEYNVKVNESKGSTSNGFQWN
ncbi:hypothetical protein C3L50_08170 [Flavobacterium alvei]|uniref:DUF4142 domain-containing protein n=1 Tax=Flavobacterium alvei TaxID=2080416 RepID=A0A2S5AB92_9FLAO|nr:hypothetical protein [Flavobacterium alvei]POY39796.1 hypothetical protein C3L50_08170 [Flavobacterium alvei]